MNISREKAEKLLCLARMYYEQNKTQNEIAAEMHISRPLVSRYLGEARACGIVRIEICAPPSGSSPLLDALCSRYCLQGGIAVERGKDDTVTNLNTARAAIAYLRRQKKLRCGIGWGSILGALASAMERAEFPEKFAVGICPLIGNSGVSNRDYHSNEIVRIFAQQTGAVPTYWHAPAIVESEQELQQLRNLENYHAICRAWAAMNLALVNIGNYPSVPDFATAARYGKQLAEAKAVGHFLCHYFDENGAIIRSESDCLMQIPVELLAATPAIVGICAANVKPEALVGALRTGIFTQLIAPADLMQAALEYSAKKP